LPFRSRPIEYANNSGTSFDWTTGSHAALTTTRVVHNGGLTTGRLKSFVGSQTIDKLHLPLLLHQFSYTVTHAALRYIDAFEPESYGGDFISPTFGPRIKVSATDAYDFHRGVGISGEVGNAIVAPFEGIVEDITAYPDGGHTVILEHMLPEPVKFTNKDKNETSIFYTLYMHLDESRVCTIG